MHYLLGVIISKDMLHTNSIEEDLNIINEGDVIAYVNEVMEEYYEEYEVEPYTVEVDDDDEIKKMKKHYKTDDIKILAKKLEEWNGTEGFVEKGKLYGMSTRNPHGKWDWFTIGGRWAGTFTGEWNPDADDKILPNIIKINDLKKSVHAILDPKGKWLDEDDYYAILNKRPYWQLDQPQKIRDKFYKSQKEYWEAKQKEILAKYKDCYIIAIDYHN